MSCSAVYSTVQLPEFAIGNPFIEALPLLPKLDLFTAALIRHPHGDFRSRNESDVVRFMNIASLLDINLPRPESTLLAMRCMSMLINSYHRNHPLSADTLRRMYSIDSTTFGQATHIPLQVDASSVLGWSGMGKSTMIRTVLELFPQVIHHENYSGKEFFRKQVVYLSVDAPISASPKGLILNIAAALDKALGLSGPGSYLNQFEGRGGSVETQRVLITRALISCGVGLLHIDDLQRLGEGTKTFRDAVSAMIIGIANTAGCSLLFSGTVDALSVLQSNFEVARRANRRGSIVLQPPTDENADFFTALVHFLFHHQLQDSLSTPTSLLCSNLLGLTAGNPGVLVMLYVATQETALLTGQALSLELFKDVLRDQFSALITPLKKLNLMRSRGNLSWDSELDRSIGHHISRQKRDMDSIVERPFEEVRQ